jgi:two-component system, LytTR family, sensor histidine kinase AlgZ
VTVRRFVATAGRQNVDNQSMGRPPEPSIIRSTLRALLQPRRLIPVVLVSASLVAAQKSFSRDPFAVPLGILMCLTFVIVAPVSWRVLFPERIDLRHGGVRLILYGAIGAGVVLSMGFVAPRMLGMGRTLLTAPSSVVVCLALFLVGGFGLARDIWLESSLARAEARADGHARDAERAQLMALRAHLDPHFLFNTLNAIAEWCREDGETAERAVVQLSAMLRTVLAGVRAPSWSLGEELALMETLFSLHRLRDPERLKVDWHLPDPLPAFVVPPMLLLPLAENAVKHGPAAGHRGVIEVEVAVYAANRQLVVTLRNPGAYGGPRPGGSGLEMVQRRLALAYDGAAMLKISAVGDSTVAEVRLPLDRAPAGSPT